MRRAVILDPDRLEIDALEIDLLGTNPLRADPLETNHTVKFRQCQHRHKSHRCYLQLNHFNKNTKDIPESSSTSSDSESGISRDKEDLVNVSEDHLISPSENVKTNGKLIRKIATKLDLPYSEPKS